VSRGLFERDKLIFSFLLSTSIDRNSDFINPLSWNLMLRGAIPLSEAQLSKLIPNPMPKAILSDLSQHLLFSAEL
jgi:dynein heavy chain